MKKKETYVGEAISSFKAKGNKNACKKKDHHITLYGFYWTPTYNDLMKRIYGSTDVRGMHDSVIKGKMHSPKYQKVYPGILINEWLFIIM